MYLSLRKTLLILAVCPSLGAGFAHGQQAKANIGRIFDRLDRNRDGQLDRTELTRQQAFDRYDTNKDDSISRQEAGLRTKATADVLSTKNVSYGSHASQKLDYYQPKNAVNAPVMVYVHGGGWRIGDKKAIGCKADFFCGHGWAFVSINYRLLPDGQHPNNVNDVAEAIAWVHKHANKLNVNANQICVMGHSAGAHLASLVATHATALESVGLTRGNLKAVISLDTNAYDVSRLMKNQAARYYGQVFGREATVWADASPAKHVSGDSDIPPFLICYSSGMRLRKDPQRATNAESFRQVLTKHGVAARVIDASDRNHSEINQRFGTVQDTRVTAEAWKFLRETLAGTQVRSR